MIQSQSRVNDAVSEKRGETFYAFLSQSQRDFTKKNKQTNKNKTTQQQNDRWNWIEVGSSPVIDTTSQSVKTNCAVPCFCKEHANASS